MLTVTKRFSFCYGHKLPEYNGKCANYHGHNSEVEVEVSGMDKDAYPSMIIDFSKLKAIVNAILVELDHKDLTEFFVDSPATAETICHWLMLKISKQLPKDCYLTRLRVSETPDSWAEWRYR